MGIFSFFNKKETRSKLEYVSPYQYGCGLSFFDSLNDYDSVYLSAVFCAITKICSSMAVLPILTDETTSQSFNNMTKTKYDTIYSMMWDLLTRGNAYLYIGNPTKPRYIPATDVTVIYNKTTDVLKYQITGIGKQVTPKDLIHIMINPKRDEFEGRGITSFAFKSLNLSKHAEEAANNFFSSGCCISGVLSVQGTLSEKQRDDIRASWNQTFNGGGGICVLPGNMSYSQLGANSADAQLLESREFQVREVARFFNINSVLLGDISKSAYSTLEQALIEFATVTLLPYITLFEEEFSRKLKTKINFDESYLLRTDTSAKATYFSTLTEKGILSINEAREELGYEPIEGGDVHAISYTDISQNTIENKPNQTNETV